MHRLELMNDRLRKSNSDRVIAGICGGLGEYFGIDPTIVRIIFVILTLWGGLGIVLYLILLFIMPDSEGKVMSANGGPRHVEARHWVGGGLILFGALLLASTLNNVYDFFPSFQLSNFVWPLIFIYLGVWFLYSQRTKH